MLYEYLNIIKNKVAEEFPFKTEINGKFIRSVVGLLVLKLWNIPIDSKILDVLSGVELVHNASLLHDDVIDNETTRRSIDSANVIFGNKLTVLYGNILWTKANSLFIKTDYRISELFNVAIGKMCEGELFQHEQEYKMPKIEDYIRKCYLKTASLFEVEIDAINILANKVIPDSIREAITDYGIAYQIKNDLKNVLETKTDIENGIYTAPVIYSGSINPNKASIEKTQCLIDNYVEKAIYKIEKYSQNEYGKELIRIIKCLMN